VNSSQIPLAAPIHANLRGLPPHLVQVGSIETLLDDPHALIQCAQAADVPMELAVWEDMPHGWHHFASILSESQQDMAHIGEFVREYVA
jgi:monoterpene epsilon-lactone hydrolase